MIFFFLSDGENVSMMVGNFRVGFFKGGSTGLDDKKSKLGLGSGSSLEARYRLRLDKCRLVPLELERA